MTRRSLALYFCPETFELLRTVAQDPLWERPLYSERAQNGPTGMNVFHSSCSVNTLSVFFLRARARAKSPDSWKPIFDERSEPTSALRIGRLMKYPRHGFLHVLGNSKDGIPLLIRSITCMNYRRIRKNPITVYYNPIHLKPESILIYLGERELTSPIEIENLASTISQRESTNSDLKVIGSTIPVAVSNVSVVAICSD